jgi:TIGR03009 family protein
LIVWAVLLTVDSAPGQPPRAYTAPATITAPAVHQHQPATITAPAVHQHQPATITAPAVHHLAQVAPEQVTAGQSPLGATDSPVAEVASASTAASSPPGNAGIPFQLDPREQQFVRQVLEMWEVESGKIQTFSCRFERWEYHPVWFSDEKPMIKSHGQLTYSKPDQGSFKIEEIRRWKNTDPQVNDSDAPGDYVLQKSEVGEHWVCDGKAVYEYDHRNKQLKVTPLPEQLRGQSIVDGPLPFLFGANAEKLLKRYWIRSPQGTPQSIWLEAYPRWQSDAANYHHVEVILNRKTMQPAAIQVHQPDGKERHVYMFDTPTINGTLNGIFGNLFSAPRTPLGWKRVVVDTPPPGPASQAGSPPSTLQR